MWQENGDPYGASSSHSQYYAQPPTSPQNPLQFYTPESSFYPGSRPSLEGQMAVQGSISVQGMQPQYGGNIQTQQGWWTAFGTGGIEGEPPLLEELGINFEHILAKTLTVLNPLSRVDEHIMDDADLAGPLLFCFCFATFLLFSGKVQFGYIYGLGLLGSVSIYALLNLMSEQGIDAYRVGSVLGYCLLPMVGVGALSVMFTLNGFVGYLLTSISIIWCTHAASGIFVAVLRLSEQRLLVAYPVGLFYGCFALLSVFHVGGSGNGLGK